MQRQGFKSLGAPSEIDLANHLPKGVLFKLSQLFAFQIFEKAECLIGIVKLTDEIELHRDFTLVGGQPVEFANMLQPV